MSDVEGPGLERAFFRVAVRLPARLRPLGADEIERLRDAVRTAPWVWAPSEAAALEGLASRPAASAERLLARAVLEVAEQVSALRGFLLEQGGPMSAATIVELSGGGGQLVARTPLEPGQRFELRIEPGGRGGPPAVRAVGEVVRLLDATAFFCAFRFDSIHSDDQDRLVAWLYAVQREAVRRGREPAGVGSLPGRRMP